MRKTSIHREDVKATLRKRYGSLENFATVSGVEPQAVRDLLRNKSSTAKPAVAEELGVQPDHLVIVSKTVPICGANTKGHRRAHRQNAGAK